MHGVCRFIRESFYQKEVVLDAQKRANRRRSRELARRQNWPNQESEVAAAWLQRLLLADPHPALTYKVAVYEAWLSNALREANLS